VVNTSDLHAIATMSEQPMSEQAEPYLRKTNVKYGERTVVGRIVGRDKVVIPEEQVAQLASYHCTNKEMADFFGVKLQTFTDNFRDIITKSKLETNQRLRKAQLDLALNKHDRVMLIWLGKNMLGQTDQPIQSDSATVLPWNETEVE
tara:strand:+ start:1965 stop:2405 length:441 start_codon:yes stop_codon:yes gene_type:complete